MLAAQIDTTQSQPNENVSTIDLTDAYYTTKQLPENDDPSSIDEPPAKKSKFCLGSANSGDKCEQNFNEPKLNVVDYLLRYPFEFQKNKKKLLSEGAKQPIIGCGCRSIFYEQFVWLTASEVLKMYFCWPCLLYSKNPDKNAAWPLATDNASQFFEHENSTAHNISEAILATDGTVMRAQKEKEDETNIIRENINLTTKKNRIMLKPFIDAIPFIGHQNHNYQSANIGLKFLSDIFKCHSMSSVLMKRYTNLTTNLIETVIKLLQTKVNDEMERTPFIAFRIVNVMNANWPGNFQIAIFARYVYNSVQICRFLGFFNLNRVQPECVAGCIGKYLLVRFRAKIVCQEYDETVMRLSLLSELKATMQQMLPSAVFMSKFNFVHGTYSIPESRVFFNQVAGFYEFFAKSTKRTKILNERASNINWNFKTQALTMIIDNRDQLRTVFKCIRESATMDRETIQTARNYIALLDDFKFNFLARTYHLTFRILHQLNEILRQQCDEDACTIKIKETQSAIDKKLRNSKVYFKQLYVRCCNIDGVQQITTIQHTYGLYRIIMGNIIEQLNVMFFHFIKLTPLTELFSSADAFNEAAKMNFVDAIGVLRKHFKKIINFDQLLAQLMIFHDNFNLMEILRNKRQLSDLLLAIETSRIDENLPEVTKLLKLIMTVSSDITDDQWEMNGNRSGVMDRLNALNVKAISPRSSVLAYVDIEQDFIKELELQSSWYDDVLDSYAVVYHKASLLYRK